MKRLSIDHQIKSAHNEYLYQVIRIISIQNKCSQLWTKMDDHISKIHRLYILIGILIYLWSYKCHVNQRRSKFSINLKKNRLFCYHGSLKQDGPTESISFNAGQAEVGLRCEFLKLLLYLQYTEKIQALLLITVHLSPHLQGFNKQRPEKNFQSGIFNFKNSPFTV